MTDDTTYHHDRTPAAQTKRAKGPHPARRCPFAACGGAPIGAVAFACSRCWERMDRRDRAELADAFADYRDNVISLPGLAAAQDRVRERLTGVASDATSLPRAAVCRRCALPVLLVTGFIDRPVALDEVRAFEAARLAGTVDLLCVVGGRAEIFMACSRPASLAKFRFHACTNPSKTLTEDACD